LHLDGDLSVILKNSQPLTPKCGIDAVPGFTTDVGKVKMKPKSSLALISAEVMELVTTI
jgi:hypothetical protein